MVDHNKYLIQLSEVLCPLVWDAPLAVLSPAEQVFVCVYDLESEVNNGGFDQFFRNSPGRYGRQAVDALDVIGATHMAEITRRATTLAFSGGNIPEDQDARGDALDAAGTPLEDALSECDNDFYRYPDDLTELLFRYVQDHKNTIRGVAPA